MKNRVIKSATRVLATAIILAIAACGPNQDRFSQKDLIGQWTVFTQGNATNGADYAYYKMTVNDVGEATCVAISDSSGRSSCDGVLLPSLSLSQSGLLSASDGSLVGTMYYDKSSVNVTVVTAYGVSQTGNMTKSAENFGPANLAGRWTTFMFNNGNPDYGWVWMQTEVDFEGNTTCLSYYSSDGTGSCDGIALPKFYISPDGLITSGSGSVSGVMDFDGTSAYLAVIPLDEGAVRSGFMTKSEENFNQTELTGKWAVQLTSNGNDANGWKRFELEIDEFGEETCLSFSDSDGNISCEGVPAPYIALQPDGSITTTDASVDGFMSFNRNTGFLVSIGANGITQTGIMTRR